MKMNNSICHSIFCFCSQPSSGWVLVLYGALRLLPTPPPPPVLLSLLPSFFPSSTPGVCHPSRRAALSAAYSRDSPLP